ncbi:FHA domain-containing protein [bacterium]|nr:FHA domain-containing protein [bacterium]
MRISPLEVVVVEGGGAHSRFFLTEPKVILGRLDPGEAPPAGSLLFPEPTVSRVHAMLDWDPKKNRYLLTHRSSTNATLVNGIQLVRPRHINPGDRIKMGRLTFELRIGKGQHADGDVATVDLAQLTRSAAASPVEAVTWVANTPIASAPAASTYTSAAQLPSVHQPLPPVPVPTRIPPPPRKNLPTPVFNQPYAPVPVEPGPPVPVPEFPVPEFTADFPEQEQTDFSDSQPLVPFGCPDEFVPTAPPIPRRIALTALPAIVPAAVSEDTPVAEETPIVEAPVDKPKPYVRLTRKIGRNEKCPCGSGVKYKKCCGR